MTDAVYSGRALPGASLAGHDIAGLSTDQIRPLLDQVQGEISLDLTVDGVTKTVTGDDLGITVDQPQILDSISRTSSRPFWIYRGQDRSPALSLTIDRARFDARLVSDFPEAFRAPVDAGLAFDPASQQFQTTAPSPGAAVDDASLRQLEQTLTAQKGRGAFDLHPVERQPDVSQDQAAAARDWLNRRLTTPCVVTDGAQTLYTFTPQDMAALVSLQPTADSGLTVSFQPADLKDFIESTLAPLAETAPVPAQVIVDATGTTVTTLREGVPGRTLTGIDELAAALAAGLDSGEASSVAADFTEVAFPTETLTAQSPASPAVSAQLDYLETYATSYNTAVWGDYNPSGGDCANFASQGLSVRGVPMDATWHSSGPGQASTAWVLAQAMDSWMAAKGWTRLGPDQLGQLKLGDIGVFDWNANGSADHVMTVSRITTDQTGAIGVYFASHNDDGGYRYLDEVTTEQHPGAAVWFYSVP